MKTIILALSLLSIPAAFACPDHDKAAAPQTADKKDAPKKEEAPKTDTAKKADTTKAPDKVADAGKKAPAQAPAKK